MPYQNNYLLEACTDSAADSVAAEKAGLHRIELCSALAEGGLTPSQSLMEATIGRVAIPVHVMIRPRGGDFFYTNDEFLLMQEDIVHAKQAGAAGVVFGILREDGTFDTERTAKLMALANPMKVVIHRAFDMSADPFLAMEAVITLGAEAVLTSGQCQTAEDGLDLIKELVKRAAGRIQIMAGSGVNSSNVKLLAAAGVRNFHFTVRKPIESPMKFRNAAMQGMGRTTGNEYLRYEFDVDKVQAILRALK